MAILPPRGLSSRHEPTTGQESGQVWTRCSGWLALHPCAPYIERAVLGRMTARPDHLTIRPNLARRWSKAQPIKLTRPARVICPSGRLLRGVSSLISDFPKNICVPTYPKSNLQLSPSHPTEGRIAIVTDAGRDAVDAAAFCARWMAGLVDEACERSPSEQTNGADADGKIVWS